MIGRLTSVLLLVSVAACGGPAKVSGKVVIKATAPVRSPGPDQETADRVVSLFASFLAELPAVDRPCEELAGSIHRFVDTHGEELRSISQALEAATLEEQGWFRNEITAAIEPSMAAAGERLLGCRADASVGDAFRRMDAL